jgi:hypothetical protein
VVPAEHKWFTWLATAAIVVHQLRTITPKYPAADPAAAERPARAELVAEVDSSRAA